jgi:CBS domain containing-hemolysin-like protein
MILDIFITILLVALNGFFVAAEFAIVKVRNSQIEILAKNGDPRALLSRNILAKLDNYLSATQLGITLASLGLGWIGESVVTSLISNVISIFGFSIDEHLLHQISLPTAFVIITILHIVFGELAPKSIAIQKPEQTTLAVAYPLVFFHFIFRPFIFVLNGLANKTLKLFGITPIHNHEHHSEQELLYILEQSSKSGTIAKDEHKIVENVFDFYDRPVKQIMRPRTQITAFDIETPFNELLQEAKESGYSRFPVYKDSIDDIVGVITYKELIREKLDAVDSDSIILANLIRDTYIVPETKKIGLLLKDMQKSKNHMAILIDEYGGTAGLVTLEDIIEELVGEIQDEFDEEKPWIEKIDDNNFMANAATVIHDANETLPFPIPEGEAYETLGGYVSFLFGDIPNINDEISDSFYTYKVITRRKNHVEKIKITLLENSKNETE